MSKDQKEQPVFNLKKAKTMVGKTILIGLTYYDHKGKFIEQKQMHGKIISVDNKRGFEIELEGTRKGEQYHLPPDLSSFKPANPGEYHEHTTGEVIVNPDYLTTWIVNKPPPDFKPDST